MNFRSTDDAPSNGPCSANLYHMQAILQEVIVLKEEIGAQRESLRGIMLLSDDEDIMPARWPL